MIDELNCEAWARFAADAGITLPFLLRRGATLIGAVDRSCANVPGPDDLRECTAWQASLIRQSLSF